MTQEDRAKVATALHLLNEAQSLVNSAASELCSVPGFGKEWSESSKIHDIVKRYWHRVNSRRIGLQERSQQKAVTS